MHLVTFNNDDIPPPCLLKYSIFFGQIDETPDQTIPGDRSILARPHSKLLLYSSLKGQQCEIFVLWFCSSIDPIWGPVYFATFFSNSNSKFELRYGRRTKLFFADTVDLKTGVVQALDSTVYIHTLFNITVSLKDIASFKNHCVPLRYGNWFYTWPIVHNQMLRHGPQRLTKSFAMAHSG